MKRNTIPALALFFLAPVVSRAQEIREPVCAGGFYDADKDALAARIDGYLARVQGLPRVSPDVRALICPHAGYVYSGQTAAYAYCLVQGKSYDAVVVIGPSHRYGFDGCSIYPRGGFKTPLGLVEVDEELARLIASKSGFRFDPEAHAEEHSVEVQVPFIQRVLPGVKIVPVVMGFPSRRTIQSLASGLAEALRRKKVLLVASTDMSHYLSKKEANEKDSRTLSLVKSLDTERIIRELGAGANIMCGGGPVASVLLALRRTGSPRVEILHYTDSSEVRGDAEPVVGYFAAACRVEAPAPEFSLSAAEKRELLKLGRLAVETFVREQRVVAWDGRNPNFAGERGAFVTLRKDGGLRGCIGIIEPLFPLGETVVRAAILAAREDPRFSPVTREELSELEVEISVLGPVFRIDDPRQVRVGRHGLVISQEGNKGLLLPQVAVENGWSRETFLREACLKAGLPEDAWKKGAEIFVFEAIVFR